MIKLISIKVNVIFKLFIGNLLEDFGRKKEAILDYARAIQINQRDKYFYNRGKY